MILNPGTKVLILHRRLFEKDSERFFLGVVDEFENGLAKVTGTTWVRDFSMHLITPKEGTRTKIFAMSSGTLMIYELPSEVDLSLVKFIHAEDGKLWMTDGKTLKLDMTERVYLDSFREDAA